MALQALRPAANAAPKTAAPARQSRWGGIKSHQPREPLLGIGTYRLEYLGAELTFNKKSGNETFQSLVKVLDAAEGSQTAIDATVKILMIVNGKSKDVGEGRVKSMSVALAGYTTDEEFDAVDPAGEFVEQTLNGAGFVGRVVDVTVTESGRSADGSKIFYEFEWAVPEGQTQMTLEG